MARYYYKARDKNGAILSGSVIAENPWLARKSLNKQNLIVLATSRFNFKLMFSELNIAVERMTSKVTFEEKMVLMNQLETGISVGIPIIQMLNLLQKDQDNRLIRESLAQITKDVAQGSTLHEAFAKHPLIFDSTVIGLVKTGELSGKLEATLSRVTSMIEQQSENEAKIKSATFYPKIVVFVMLVVVSILVYFVIPKLKTFLTAFGVELPLVTRIVVGTSDFFISYWYVILAAVLGIRYAFKKIISIPKWKSHFDFIKLKAPIFGVLFLHLELNNFCVILDLMLDSGIPILEALNTLKESQKNEIFKNALSECHSEIERGGSILAGLDKTKVFPGSFKNLLGVGEESGLMQPVLKRLGRYYQLQIDHRLDNLSKLIEPILLFLIFAIVLVIVLAVMLPIWNLAGSRIR